MVKIIHFDEPLCYNSVNRCFFGTVNKWVRGDRLEDQKRDDRHAACRWSGIETWGFDC